LETSKTDADLQAAKARQRRKWNIRKQLGEEKKSGYNTKADQPGEAG